MKKYSLFLLALLAVACKKEEKPLYSVLNGTVENNTAQTVFVRGNDFEKRTQIGENGAFTDTLDIDKDGFYEMYVGRERTEIYLEKGKNLSVTLDANAFDETLTYTGDLGNINNFLAQKYLWNEQHLDYKELFSKDEASFVAQLNTNQEQIDSLYRANNISNEKFREMLGVEDKYARAIMFENYAEAHRYFSGNSDFNVSSTFYDELKDLNYADTLAFRNSAAYQSMLDAHFNRLVAEAVSENGSDDQAIRYMNQVDKSLPDGYAKDKIMSSYLQFGMKPDENLETVFTIYKNSNPNQENLAKLTERYNKLKTITIGNPSPTFNFENHKGGYTSLESLKGKYVYIDVWATWCGPCLREIPFLQQIENDYHGKNVQFVSISIDEPKDYNKWKTMVAEKALGGIQLMADNNWNSKFVKDYAILGIPRFILIDPQGNIVSADAPRPSDPELRTIFDELM